MASSWSQLAAGLKKSKAGATDRANWNAPGPSKPSQEGTSKSKNRDAAQSDDNPPHGERARLDDLLGRKTRKVSAFDRPAPNLSARSSRYDAASPVEATKTSSSAIGRDQEAEEVRKALERKAKLYDKLQRGKTAGLTQDSILESSVDWQRKEREKGQATADDVDTDTEDRQSDIEEDMTEYEDEFGRTRRVRRSDIPRHAAESGHVPDGEHGVELPTSVLYGPATSFPVYRPDSSRALSNQRAEHQPGGYKRDAPDHFDAKQEKRHRGAGFFQFSRDEEERQRQMDQLRRRRAETERQRAQRGAGRS